MTQELKLKKIIKKAVENKWLWSDFDKHYTLLIWQEGGCLKAIKKGDYFCVIFSHNFAKAFWGEEKGYNEVDFIYCKQKGTKVLDSTLTPEDFLKHNSQKELNLLLDKKVHIFGNIDYLGEVTYYRVKEGWKYHIQQLALIPENERIDYLYKFVENE